MSLPMPSQALAPAHQNRHQPCRDIERATARPRRRLHAGSVCERLSEDYQTQGRHQIKCQVSLTGVMEPFRDRRIGATGAEC